MAQIKTGDPHGLYRVLVGLVNTTGYNVGTAGPGVANGTLVQPYILKYPKDATMPVPDRTVIDFTGGDVWTGSYVYGFTSLGTGTLTSSTVDATLVALVSGSQVDNTTNTRTTLFSENVNRSTPPQSWVAVIFRIQSKETGSVGADKFLTIIAPRSWVVAKGVTGAPAFQTAGQYDYSVVITMSDRTPWGITFANLGMSLSENQAPMFYAITDYPIHVVGMFAESGATEVVTLPYKPAPAGYDYTTPDSSDDPVQVYVDGVLTDATTVVEATGAVTVTAAFAGGEYIGIFYETEYVATA